MNIYDIAKEAGVSIATVSRVLNNKSTVSPATRAKVEQVLAANHYTPSAIARGMVSKSMRTVAVLTVDVRVPHYARTAYTLEREFSRRGYEVILCNTGGDREATLTYLRAVVKKQVDGIVLVGSVFNTICRGSEMTGLLRKTPVVLANGTLPLPNASSVLVDDRLGVSLAVEHLLGRGRRALFYVKDKSTDSANEKRDGFVQAMTRAGLHRPHHRDRRNAGGRHGGRAPHSGKWPALRRRGVRRRPYGGRCAENPAAQRHRGAGCRRRHRVQPFRLRPPLRAGADLGGQQRR